MPPRHWRLRRDRHCENGTQAIANGCHDLLAAARVPRKTQLHMWREKSERDAELRHCRDTLLRSLTLLCDKVDRGGYQGPYPAHRSSESRTSAHLTGTAARHHVQALLRRDTPHSLYPERVEHTVARSLS